MIFAGVVSRCTRAIQRRTGDVKATPPMRRACPSSTASPLSRVIDSKRRAGQTASSRGGAVGNRLISVFYAFARSGGTLLNRCLASIPGNLVLSEINPHGSPIPIEEQARKWLALLSEEEVSRFAGLSYCRRIRFLRDRAAKGGSSLIIRDWPSVNFLDEANPGCVLRPSLILEQALYLDYCQIAHKSIVLSRRAADVYDSVKRTFPQYKALAIEHFAARYLKYATAVAHYKIFHYEDLCRRPEETVREICEALHVNYNAAFLEAFSNFDRCTGDNLQATSHRGKRLLAIMPLTSNIDSPYYLEAKSSEDCHKADRLFGYAA